jgi:hypothetical protein
MISYRKQRQLRNRLRFSEMGKKSQAVQSARRAEGAEERLRALEEIQIQNLPKKQGDPVGSFQWTDFRTGKVRRWTVRIGDRAGRYTFEDSHGTTTKPHGFTWFFTRLRTYLLRKA